MHIKVHGLPAGQGSKTRGANGQMRESSRNLPAWREAIRAETQRAVNAFPTTDAYGKHIERTHTGAVEVTVTLLLPRPRSHWRIRGGELVDELKPDAPAWPIGKPDADKLLRAVMDGITAGGALADDALAVVASVTKDYAGFGQPAGCEVWIDPLRPHRARFTVSDPAREAIAAARASGAISGG